MVIAQKGGGGELQSERRGDKPEVLLPSSNLLPDWERYTHISKRGTHCVSRQFLALCDKEILSFAIRLLLALHRLYFIDLYCLNPATCIVHITRFYRKL